MSENTNVTATTPAPAPENTAPPASAEKPPRQSMGSKREEIRAKLNAGADKIFAKPTASTPNTSTPTPEETPKEPSQPETADKAGAVEAAQEVSSEAGKTAEKLDEKGEKVPEKKEGESARQYEHRLAQLLLKVQRAEADSLKHKSAFESASTKLKELEAKLEEASKDPVKALKLANCTPDELAQMMLDGKLTKAEEKAVKAELPPEVQELLEEAKRLKAEKAQAEERAKAEEQRKQNVAIVEKARAASVAEYPVLDAVSSEVILTAIENHYANTGVEPAFGEIAEKLQDLYVADLKHFLLNDNVVGHLVKASPEIKEKLVKLLGLEKPAPVATAVTTPEEKPEPSKTLTNAAGAAPVKTTAKLSEKERRQRAAAAAASIFEKR